MSMPPRDVHDWIARWEHNGLIDDDTAHRLRDDATRAGTAPQIDGPDAVERVIAAARGGVTEALGYVGAALSLGAIVVLFDVASWSDPLLALMLAAAAVAAASATYLLTPPASPAGRRLAGVLGALATVATAAATAYVVGGEDRGIERAPWRLLAMTAPALVVATVMYRRHRHLLTHAALGGAAVAATVGLGELLAGRDAPFDAQDAVVGTLLLVLAIAWTWASETGRLDSPWLGTLGAGGVAYAAMAMATSWSPLSGSDGDLPILASLALAAAATAVGVATSTLRVTIVGAAGLLVTVPMTFVEVLGWSGTETAGLLLPIGVAVTAWAVVAGRRDDARDGT